MNQEREHDNHQPEQENAPLVPREDGSVKIPLDDARSQQGVKDKDETGHEIEEAVAHVKERVTELGRQADQEIGKLQDVLSFPGGPVQLAQQNSLMVLAAQLIASTVLSLLISQINPLQVVWEWLPLLDYITVITFFVTEAIVQFYKPILVQPWNLVLCILHTVSKIFLLTYMSVWLEDIRVEVFQVNVIFLVGYMLFNIYVDSQKRKTTDVSIKGNWVILLCYATGVSLFLTLFVRATWGIWIMLTLFSSVYAFFLLICMQRFPEHTYLLNTPNDFYLGAAQLDADLVYPCYIIRYLIQGIKKEEEVQI